MRKFWLSRTLCGKGLIMCIIRQDKLDKMETNIVLYRLPFEDVTHVHKFWFDPGVPRGSVIKCLTRNPGVLDSGRTGSSGIFHGSVLGQDTSEPSLVLVKPMKDMNNVICCRDMTEILLKAV